MKKNERMDRKVFLLGLDGLPPETFRRFLLQGHMPHFTRLLERASVFDVVPTLPATTAPGWLTIASGAYPSTIGVENILLPTPGETPDKVRNGFASEWSHAEYIWETLDRFSRNAIVLKYPGSWPPRKGNFVQVDGAGGYADITCQFDALLSYAYTSSQRPDDESSAADAIFPDGYQDHWRIDTGQTQGVEKIVVRDPIGWVGLPEHVELVFEFVFHVRERGKQLQRNMHALAFRDNTQSKQACLLLSPSKNVPTDAILLHQNEWSRWVFVERTNDAYAHRFRLLALDLEQRLFHLYQTEGHCLDGFTKPQELAGELLQHVGPPVEWTGTYDLMNGLIDLETQFEIYAQHTKWMIDTIKFLGTSRPWHGFFTHWHVIEYAHHLIGASLHPEHPLHQPANVSRDLDFLSRVYSLADSLLEAVEAVIDDQTLLVIGSDHGHDLVHSIFYINQFLKRHGWLTTKQHAGRQVIDWAHSVAYALFPGCILLNRVGRWSEGIVQEKDSDAIVQDITEALKGLVDSRTGRHPIKVILMREELRAFGQMGPQAPDLFFCMERGYEPATRLHSDIQSEFEIAIPYKEVTSGHGSFFPLSPSARTLAILAGPADYPFLNNPYPISVMDLAPTMTAFLGIPMPRHCQGHAITPYSSGETL